MSVLNGTIISSDVTTRKVRMKRLDLEPTKDALLESLQLDSAGRNQDAIDFIKMLAETEGPYSYMIDATWGDGKTFFC